MTTPLEDDEQPEFKHPYVTVDLVTVVADDNGLRLFVMERDEKPFGWALPGAFVQMDEDVTDTATRVGREKLGIDRIPELIALRPFGTPGRDDRRRVITLPHLALLPATHAPSTDRARAGQTRWAHARITDGRAECLIDGQPTPLVFDHNAIVLEALEELHRRVQLDDPLVYRRLLPDTFTLRRYQAVHEALIGQDVNRDSFRRRVLMSGRLEQTEHREANVEHRPASLYRWRNPS